MDIGTSQRVCGLLSRLLEYPSSEWRQHLPAAREMAAEIAAADAEAARHIEAFLNAAESAGEIAWQEQYVRTFDFGRTTNLYLTYEQHGEERERGAALLAWKRRYAEAGFILEDGELADYLPLVLEFAASASWSAAQEVLAWSRPALHSIRLSLAEAGSPYTGLFELLLQIVPEAPAELAAEPTLTGRGDN
ncbi:MULTISPECIES: nitrate reductase molybdenum cofactor assembly chaperone [Brevibacillus]|jgi:nitrate reductase delta subunit|uniref:Nitrate reductase molybdenum cofactor assembly chaperone n=1 Tax=Brevibacillus aydinogluensis TaxID=927786 RepID=A0AA48M9W9_9BACL|nr:MULTISPECIES: nitrate reductase molybdenum cofactor assembly chaperone [Bacillales]MBR8661064.1 nitrate reductase molybdenum cofactor assembly chaperone [Brevibacillus sp. NL20B1]MDT3417528.1 nitrate reductase delta subunit [Brevibacillus aydinogluensis]UFJ62899.1 nitrate reductase molybdenum cofactor assembly chaperone [Anoxybacillus sediminis]CAJ1003948.1 nitrate reductase molybdenum cofactor assembly chaperone [Brevibacillus aydinogluensis]